MGVLWLRLRSGKEIIGTPIGYAELDDTFAAITDDNFEEKTGPEGLFRQAIVCAVSTLRNCSSKFGDDDRKYVEAQDRLIQGWKQRHVLAIQSAADTLRGPAIIVVFYADIEAWGVLSLEHWPSWK